VFGQSSTFPAFTLTAIQKDLAGKQTAEGSITIAVKADGSNAK
jgi:hypothetical protein